jgi:uncharacterized membrane protein YfcA
MSLAFVLFMAATVTVAAFVQSTVGVGFALIVAPILAFLHPELLPTALLVLMLPLNLYVAWSERHALDRLGASWITLGRTLGTFGGLWVLATWPPHALNLLIGGGMILAAVASIIAPEFKPDHKAFVTAGIITGISETATGIGGPPLALAYQHHSPQVLRATVAFCFLLGGLISLTFLAVAGRAEPGQIATAALFIPPLALGALVGRAIRDRINGALLRRCVLIFAIASGAALLLRF